MDTVYAAAGAPFRTGFSWDNTGESLTESPTYTFEVRDAPFGALVASGSVDNADTEARTGELVLEASETEGMGYSVLYGVVFGSTSAGMKLLTELKLIVSASTNSSAPALGSDLPMLPVRLLKNSDQSFSLKWTPPDEETLDMTGLDIYLEIDGPTNPVTFLAATTRDDDTEQWISTWTIDDSESNWDFVQTTGRIYSMDGTERTVLISCTFEVVG